MHLAARVHHPGEEDAGELYRAVNTEGTLQLARCAAAAGVRRFVYVSTILVNGSSTDGRAPFREDDIPAPRGVYGNSKAAAEAGLRQLAETVDMRIAVIRPPLDLRRRRAREFQAAGQGNAAGYSASIRCDPQSPRFPGRRESCLVHREPSCPARTTNSIFFWWPTRCRYRRRNSSGRSRRAAGSTARLVPVPVTALKVLLKMSGRSEARDSLIGSMEIDVSKVAATGWRPPLGWRRGCAVRCPLLKPSVAAKTGTSQLPRRRRR